MAFCRKCGVEIDDEAVICPTCGVATGYKPAIDEASKQPSFGYGLLGLCIPVVGLILYLVWKEDKPGYALSAGKGALFSVIIVAIIYLIYIIIFAALFASMHP